MKNSFFACLLFLIVFSIPSKATLNEVFNMPLPTVTLTANSNKNIAHTMYLLATSTPQHRNTVRIQAYGQSIVALGWWADSIRNFLETTYPNAVIDFRINAIPGFSTDYLWKTIPLDVYTFNPHLVFMHDYGSQNDYERIIQLIRANTCAEMLLITDHYTKADSWSDYMANTIFPPFKTKYGVEIADLRKFYKAYIDKYSINPALLLKDGVHLNDSGSWLYYNILKPYFSYNSAFNPDSFGMSKSFNVANLHIVNDTLIMPFNGNEVEILANNAAITGNDRFEVLIDDKHPSEYDSCYYFTRPNETGRSWPWNTGIMYRIYSKAHLKVEKWELTVTAFNAADTTFDFDLNGSVTGYDGSGNSKNNFVSNSNRVAINNTDWHFKRTGYIPSVGYKIKWEVIGKFTDTITPVFNANNTIVNTSLVAQGIGNKYHVLKLIKKSGSWESLQSVVINRPPYNRGRSKALLTYSPSNIVLPYSAENVDLSINVDTFWHARTNVPWLTTNLNNGFGNITTNLSMSQNTSDSIRTGSLFLLPDTSPVYSIKIQQLAQNPSISIMPKNNVRNYSAASFKVAIKAGLSYTLTPSQTWITLNKYSGYNSNTITISLKRNMGATRSAYVVVAGAQMQNDTIFIEQTSYGTSTNDRETTQELIWLTPNPAHEVVYLATNGSVEIVKVEVYNLLGRLMFNSEVGNSFNEINLSGYEKGIYLVKIYTNYGGVITKKLSVR